MAAVAASGPSETVLPSAGELRGPQDDSAVSEWRNRRQPEYRVAIKLGRETSR
jgi:hypothetical protein